MPDTVPVKLANVTVDARTSPAKLVNPVLPALIVEILTAAVAV
jgi:hypothetical protein